MSYLSNIIFTKNHIYNTNKNISTQNYKRNAFNINGLQLSKITNNRNANFF